jgi:hypothetical protein
MNGPRGLGALTKNMSQRDASGSILLIVCIGKRNRSHAAVLSPRFTYRIFELFRM